MATIPKELPDQSLGTLLSGIFHDGERLLQQQIELTKTEIKQDFETSTKSAAVMGVSIGVAFVGALLLSFMLVYFLSWLIEGLPLWASFGITGAIILVVGIVLFQSAKKTLKENNPLYPEESIKQAKENLECLVHPK